VKIKIKIKHLVYSLLVLFALLPFFAYVVEPKIEFRMAQNEIQSGEKEGKERVLKLLESAQSSDKRWEIIREFIQVDIVMNPRAYDVYITPGTSQYSLGSSSSQSSPFSLEEKVPYYLEYIQEAPVDLFTMDAVTQLVYYYTLQGNNEKAEEILVQAESRISHSKWRNNERFFLQRVQLYINQGKLEQAEKRLNELQEQEKVQSEAWTKLQVHISILRGDLKLALQQVEEGIESYRQSSEEHNKQMEEEFEKEDNEPPIHAITDPPSLTTIKIQLEKTLQSGEENLTILKGNVTRSDGTPMGNVGVFLRHDSNVHRSVIEEDPYQAITAADGSYMIVGVLPGSYQLGLGLSFDQVDGWTWPVETDEWIDITGKKEVTYDVTFQPLLDVIQPVNYETLTEKSIHFEWEEVEGAAYYTLSVGVHHDSGSSSSPFRFHIRDNNLEVNVQELYAKEVGVSYSNLEGEVADTATILAFSNPQGKFSWSITAYDANDRVITRSNGYRLNEEKIGDLPFFHLKERELTKADQLLLDRKINEAFQQYKRDSEVKSNNTHASRMVLRLDRHDFNDSPLSENEKLKYIKVLAEQEQSSEDIYTLVRYYYNNQMWSEYHEWFDRYKALNEKHNEELNTYVESLHAIALMREGLLEEARKHFAKVVPMDGSHRFVGHWLALEYYLGTPLDKVVELSKEFPERGLSDTPDWTGMLLSLQEAERISSDSNQFLHAGLTYHIEGKSENLEQHLKTEGSSAQKRFLKALMNSR
jgi:tetratricopeptide (TPR) repeat protein